MNKYALRVVLLAAASLLGLLIWRSLGWPFIHDQPILHYVAWSIASGAAPYRDVFDMNFPGAYLMHLVFFNALGSSDAGWRALDLVWLVGTAVLIFLYCRRLVDPWSALTAAVLFALYHLADGAAHAGQRDFFQCALLLLGAFGVVRFWETAGQIVPLWWAGLAIGAAITIKPFAVLFSIGCAGIVAVGARRFGKPLALTIGSHAAATSVPLIAAFSWVAARGGLPAFIDLVTGYLPLYSQAGRGSLPAALSYSFYHLVPLLEVGLREARLARFFSAAVVVVAVSWFVVASWRQSFGIRHGVALMGMGYGILHYFAQGKIWPYHMYPWVLFFCVLAATAVAAPLNPGRAHTTRWPGRQQSAALLLLVLFLTGIGLRGWRGTNGMTTNNDISGAAEARQIAAIAQDLQRLVPPGSTVQVMDPHNTAIQALLKLGIHQPTRFIYDFHFFHHQSDPYIRALRAEFVADLSAAPPAAIVVTPDYARIAEFPAVAELLEEQYQVAADRKDYRVYVRQSAHAPDIAEP